MADDRERNQGIQQGGKDVAGGGGQQAPGKNPQDDRAANDQQKGGQQGGQQAPGRNPDEDRSAGGGQKGDQKQGEGNKEGGQNEQTRR